MSGSAFHSDQDPVDGIHVVHTWEYANAAARVAHTPTVGPTAALIASDVGRVAKQEDDDSFWILRSVGPVVWAQFAPAAGGGSGDVVGPASSTDNAIARYDGATGKLLQNSTVTVADDGKLGAIKTASYAAEFDAGNSGVSKTISWLDGQKQRLTMTGAAAISFINPTGPCNLMLRLIQDGTGGRTATWAAVKWPGGSPPSLSPAPAANDLVALYFDGTTYYGVASLNFL